MNNLLAGTLVDERYMILNEIGSGGMGTIYCAKEVGLGRLVALKALHLDLLMDEEHRVRFKREGKVLSELSHKNIVTVYKFGIWHQFPYIAMEHIAGVSLRSVMNNRSLGMQDYLRIALQVCDGMQSAHNAGIVHRDLKPDNIMLCNEESDRYLVKILDFGLARILSECGDAGQLLTQTGMLVGSPQYMSPEQCMGKRVDSRSDVYSLGCIMFEALTGVPPFSADAPAGLLYKHTTEPVPRLITLNREIPKGLEAIVLRAMEKDPDDRYQTMIEMQHDLNLILQNKAEHINLPLPVVANSSGVKRIVPIFAGTVVLVLAAILLMNLVVKANWRSAMTTSSTISDFSTASDFLRSARSKLAMEDYRGAKHDALKAQSRLYPMGLKSGVRSSNSSNGAAESQENEVNKILLLCELQRQGAYDYAALIQMFDRLSNRNLDTSLQYLFNGGIGVFSHAPAFWAAKFFYMAGEREQAQGHFEKAREFGTLCAEKAGSWDLRASAHMLVARSLESQKRYAEAQKELEQVVDIRKEHHGSNLMWLSQAYLDLANNFILQSKCTLAEQAFANSISSYGTRGTALSDELYAASLARISETLAAQGQTEEAKKLLLLYDDRFPLPTIVAHETSLADTMVSRNDEANAEVLYKRALFLSLKQGYKSSAALTRNQLGLWHSRHGDHAASEALLRLALVGFKQQMEPPQIIANCLYFIAVECLYQKHRDQAYAAAMEAEKLFNSVHWRSTERAACLRCLGELQYDRKEYSEGTAFFQRAIVLLQDCKRPKDAKEILAQAKVRLMEAQKSNVPVDAELAALENCKI